MKCIVCGGQTIAPDDLCVVHLAAWLGSPECVRRDYWRLPALVKSKCRAEAALVDFITRMRAEKSNGVKP